MVRTLAALVVLAVLPSPSFGAIALDAASVGAGPYYLDRAGETYVLSDDISVPGTAFVFAAENVTLDLNGHTVTFGAAVGKYRYGVVVPPPYAHVNPIFSQSDVTRWLSCSGATVRNGSMTQGEARSDSCAAVLAYGESRITLSGLNIQIYGNDTFAILLAEGRDWVIYGNTISDSTRVVSNRHMGRAAIDLVAAGDGRLEIFGNTIHACAQWGIRVSRRGTATTWGRICDNDIFPNTVVTNGYGIGAHASKLEVYGNRIVAANGRGIHAGADSLRIVDNFVEVIEQPWWDEYTRVSAHGIKIEGANHTEVARNTVMSFGLVEDPLAESIGAALSLSLSPGTTNWVHDNVFSTRHRRGRSFDPAWYLSYAAAVEFATADSTSEILIENNRFVTNDRFLAFVGWYGADGQPAPGNRIVFSGNSFEWDTEAALTGRPEIFVGGSSFSGIVLLDSSFDSGVDFRRFTAGWPWSYCSWGVGSALGVRTVDPDGGAVAGVAVEGRDAMGGTQAAAVSDALGKATLGLPLFSVDTEGSGIEQVTHVVQHNPYTVIGRFVEGEVQAAVEAGTPGMVVELVSSGDTGSVIPSPGEPSWSFEVLTTTPAGSAAKVPGGSEIRWLFTKPVLLDTITGPACAITGTLSGSIRGSFTLGLSGRLVVFRPDDGFAPGEEITASLSGQVRSQSGDFLDGNRDGLAGGSAEDAYELRFLVEGPAAP